VEQDHKITVQPLVMADEFVGKAQAREEATLFEPEDGTEAGREENSFNNGKSNEMHGKGVLLHVTPIEHKVTFLGNCQHGVHAMKEAGKVGVDEEAVGLPMDGFDGLSKHPILLWMLFSQTMVL
jgi:hypothetical protein